MKRKPKPNTLIKHLQKAVEALGWEMHIPVKPDGEIIPYAIIGRPIYANIIKNSVMTALISTMLGLRFAKNANNFCLFSLKSGCP
jgi:hypothetical protein